MEPDDDWDDDEYLYCTEFLLLGDDLDVDGVQEFVSSQGARSWSWETAARSRSTCTPTTPVESWPI